MRHSMKEEKTWRTNSAQDAHQLENLTTLSFLTHNKGNCPQDVCSTRSYTERILLRSTDERVSSSALMFHNHRFCTMAKSHNIIREGIPGKKIFQLFLAYRTVLTHLLDFFLFPKVKKDLKGHRFGRVENAKAAVLGVWIGSQIKTFYAVMKSSSNADGSQRAFLEEY